MRFMPTESEVKMLRQYERERRPMDGVTDEDRFMMLFSKIERLPQRMTIMAFMGNFSDSLQMLTPVSWKEKGGIISTLLILISTKINLKCIYTFVCLLLLFSLQQLHAIIAASVSIKSSQKLKKILEVSQYNCNVTVSCRFKALFVINYMISLISDHFGPWELHEQ